MKLIFKVSPMIDVNNPNLPPEFFTILCKEKSKRTGWMYCISQGEIIKKKTREDALSLCKKIKSDYLNKTNK